MSQWLLGLHATIFAGDIARRYSGLIDGVLRGEAEKTFLRLVGNVEERGS